MGNPGDPEPRSQRHHQAPGSPSQRSGPPGGEEPDDLHRSAGSARAHRQSRQVADRARVCLEEASTGDYTAFQRAVFGFEESLALWPENHDAAGDLTAALQAYTKCALDRQDLDLAASLVDETKQPGLARSITAARQRRDARARRLKVISRTAVVLAAALVVVFTISHLLIMHERNRARSAEAMAAEQRNIALQTLDTVVFEIDRELAKRPAMQKLRQALLDRAIDGLDRVVATTSEEERIDKQLAAAHQSMAKIFFNARRNQEARCHQQRTLEGRRALAQEQQTDEARLALALATSGMGEIVANFRMGDQEQAREHYRNAIRILRRLYEEERIDEQSQFFGWIAHLEQEGARCGQ